MLQKEKIVKVIITYAIEDLEHRPSVDVSFSDWCKWASTSYPLDWETKYEETDMYTDRKLENVLS